MIQPETSPRFGTTLSRRFTSMVKSSTPHCDYVYDAVYRLIEAKGREHVGQLRPPETTWNDEFRVSLQHPHDGQAMRHYVEHYVYDEVGNFEKLTHQAANGDWTRAYTYAEASLLEPDKKNNRLSSTVVHPNGSQPIVEPYTHDAHGNMTSMPHLTQMEWDFKDQLQATARQVVNEGTPETTYYVYDGTSQRVRKVTELATGHVKDERVYLGGFEIYRRHGGVNPLVRETLHIMDDKQRVALVETRTQGIEPGVPVQLIRYQFANHLGSASLELDDQAQIISYEEYYPYGSTSYQAVNKNIKAAAKRYRYTGMERDEETGLSYHGARYYVAWLGRWGSCDPIGLEGGANLFGYSHSNPILFLDPGGKSPRKVPQSLEDHAKDAFEQFLIGQGVDYQREVAITVVANGEFVKGTADFLVNVGPGKWEPVEFKGTKGDPLTTGQKKYLEALRNGAPWASRSNMKSALKGADLAELVGTGGGKVITFSSVHSAKQQFKKITSVTVYNRTKGVTTTVKYDRAGGISSTNKALPAHLEKPGSGGSGGGKGLLGKAGAVGSVVGGVFTVGAILFGGADAEAAAISTVPFVGEVLAGGYTHAKAKANELLAIKRTEDDAFAVLDADRRRAAQDKEAEKAADEEERKDLQGGLVSEIARELSAVQDSYPPIETDISDIPSDFVEAVINAYKRQN